MIRERERGVELDVRVIPRARKTEIAGNRGEALLVRLAAPPVDGAANDLLLEFLAASLSRPKRDIHLVSGERGRLKRIRVDGISREEAERLLLGGDERNGR